MGVMECDIAIGHIQQILIHISNESCFSLTNFVLKEHVRKMSSTYKSLKNSFGISPQLIFYC